MNDNENFLWEESLENIVSDPKDFEQAANSLCEHALNDAKAQLHPLLRNVELERLEKRSEFIQAFKQALEERIAHKLAIWQPGIQAVFQFEESWMDSRRSWDGSVHLLVKVPGLSNRLKTLGRKLDRNLVNCLRQMGWSRFQKRRSILEIQQVTPNEVRHATGYGAMFCAAHNVPVKVWPQGKKRSG
ncbi:MAG TPA: hypothetical protein VJ785_12130 [Anaerolineales bacterium]|nr:hypothetical protein [Anaerolineales bacterium]